MRGFTQKAEATALSRVLEARLQPLGAETVGLAQADRRVLAREAIAQRAVRARSVLESDFDASGLDPPAELGRDPAPVREECGLRAGDVLFHPGHRMRPLDLALLALAGVREIAVVRRPVVELLITGNELLPCGSRPDGFRIVDSNSVMLAALAVRDGGCPNVPRLLPDKPEALRLALLTSSADVLLTSGGTSVGVEDVGAEVLSQVGELTLHGIAMRPGSPAGLGFVQGRPVFLLPGNPVACLCAYDLFAGHAIRRLSGGVRDLPYPMRVLPLGRDLPSAVGRLDYVRVRVQDGRAEPLSPTKGSGASILSSTTAADGFLLIPPERAGLQAGEQVIVYLYGSFNATSGRS
jgi:molybdopterin molybdotransferase